MQRIEGIVGLTRRGLFAAALVAALFITPPPATAAAVDYARAPLDGWDVDGAVYALEVVGDTLYIGGDFDKLVSPDGSDSVARSNIAAIDLGSDTVLPFVANTNGEVTAIEADGARVFIGGEFTTVGGVSRQRIAAVDAATGALISGFDPAPNARVRDIARLGSTLYVAGDFTTIAGLTGVEYLTALNPTTGARQAGFEPNPDQPVYALTGTANGDTLYAGGAFFDIGGVSRRWLRELDPVSGAAVGPLFAQVVSVVLDLELSADGSILYGGVGGSRNAAIAWNTSTGAIIWQYGVRGDVQGIELAGGNLFFGFHDRTTDDPTIKLLAADAETGVLEDTFRPPIDSGFGVFSVVAHDAGLSIGGTFRTVSGVTTRGLATFPVLTGGGGGGGGGGGDTTPPSVPTNLRAVAANSSMVELSWNAASDAGGIAYYQLRRDGIDSASVAATTYADTGLASTTDYTYRVAAVDRAGNISAFSPAVTVTTPTRFADVSADNVFAADIEWLAESGITLGCNPPENDRFCPDASVTRGQMAAFLVRALDLTDSGSVDFTDDDESVFESDIEKLATEGVTRGCNPPANNRFCPDDPVTRGQMAAFLVRAMGYTAVDGSDFVDDNGSVFESDIEKLAAAGVTRGCNPPDNDRFCPDEPVTRGQMAAFLRRALATVG